MKVGRKMSKKLLCIIVSIMMLGTMIAVPAFAVPDEGTGESSEKQTKDLGVYDFTIVKGATHKLEPKGDYDFSYKSDKTAVAEVDKDGIVTANGAGDATITITATEKQPAGETATETENEAAEGTVEKPEQEGEGGSSETPSTTPSDEPKKQDVKVKVVDISCEDLSIEEDETGVLKPSVEGEVYTFSFEAVPADTDIIKVDNDGTVEGLKPGKAAVNVRVNGIIGAKEVTVTVTAGGFAFEIPDPMPAEFVEGDFGDKVLAYKYKDPETKEEVVTTKKERVAAAFGVTESAENASAEMTTAKADLADRFMKGEIQVWEVYKYKKKTKNLMNLEDMTLTYGETVNLKDKALNKDAKFTFESDDLDVVRVDSKGNLKTEGAGEAEITVTCTATKYYREQEKKIKVTVKKPYATTLSVKALSGKDKKKIRLTWKPVKGASKYQIYVYNTKKTVTIKTSSLVGSHQDKYGNFYYTHTKLKAGKTYKYKVRAISYSASGKAYYGSYSSAKSAKAKRR